MARVKTVASEPNTGAFSDLSPNCILVDLLSKGPRDVLEQLNHDGRSLSRRLHDQWLEQNEKHQLNLTDPDDGVSRSCIIYFVSGNKHALQQVYIEGTESTAIYIQNNTAVYILYIGQGVI